MIKYFLKKAGASGERRMPAGYLYIQALTAPIEG